MRSFYRKVGNEQGLRVQWYRCRASRDATLALARENPCPSKDGNSAAFAKPPASAETLPSASAAARCAMPPPLVIVSGCLHSSDLQSARRARGCIKQAPSLRRKIFARLGCESLSCGDDLPEVANGPPAATCWPVCPFSLLPCYCSTCPARTHRASPFRPGDGIPCSPVSSTVWARPHVLSFQLRTLCHQKTSATGTVRPVTLRGQDAPLYKLRGLLLKPSSVQAQLR